MIETDQYEVYVQDDAKLMLFEHAEFLARVNIDAAERLYAAVYTVFRSLETFPYRCPIYETENTEAIYRRFIVDRYAILYTIDEPERRVWIEYILDLRRNNEI
jgi:plasmid stabilization system protein ParE